MKNILIQVSVSTSVNSVFKILHNPLPVLLPNRIENQMLFSSDTLKIGIRFLRTKFPYKSSTRISLFIYFIPIQSDNTAIVVVFSNK